MLLFCFGCFYCRNSFGFCYCFSVLLSFFSRLFILFIFESNKNKKKLAYRIPSECNMLRFQISRLIWTNLSTSHSYTTLSLLFVSILNFSFCFSVWFMFIVVSMMMTMMMIYFCSFFFICSYLYFYRIFFSQFTFVVIVVVTFYNLFLTFSMYISLCVYMFQFLPSFNATLHVSQYPIVNAHDSMHFEYWIWIEFNDAYDLTHFNLFCSFALQLDSIH